MNLSNVKRWCELLSWLERYGELEAVPEDLIGRARVDRVLRVERRRALQLMEDLPGKTVSTSKLVDPCPALALTGARPNFVRLLRQAPR